MQRAPRLRRHTATAIEPVRCTVWHRPQRRTEWGRGIISKSLLLCVCVVVLQVWARSSAATFRSSARICASSSVNVWLSVDVCQPHTRRAREVGLVSASLSHAGLCCSSGGRRAYVVGPILYESEEAFLSLGGTCCLLSVILFRCHQPMFLRVECTCSHNPPSDGSASPSPFHHWVRVNLRARERLLWGSSTLCSSTSACTLLSAEVLSVSSACCVRR